MFKNAVMQYVVSLQRQFRVMTQFIPLLDTVRDYTWQFMIKHTHTQPRTHYC
jgi:hypothetical protein